MKQLLTLYLVALLVACNTKSDHTNKVEHEQVRRNAVFINPEQSPLDTVEINYFKGLHFYPADESYCITASIQWLPNITYFGMPHTLGDTVPYMHTANIQFELMGQPFELEGYQTDEMKAQRILFVPFTDLTNQKETYGGGRYLDLSYVHGRTTLELDFNFAYAPFCAHSKRYSCPKVPRNNHLTLAIRAGERL